MTCLAHLAHLAHLALGSRMMLGISARFCAVSAALSALAWFATPGHYPLHGWACAALAILAGLVWLAEKEAPAWSTR